MLRFLDGTVRDSQMMIRYPGQSSGNVTFFQYSRQIHVITILGGFLMIQSSTVSKLETCSGFFQDAQNEQFVILSQKPAMPVGFL